MKSVGETLSDAETGSSAWPMLLPAPAAIPLAAAATAGTLPTIRRTRTIQPAAVVRARFKFYRSRKFITRYASAYLKPDPSAEKLAIIFIRSENWSPNSGVWV